MCGGTVRLGLCRPGVMGADEAPADAVPLWQRLYFRPLPHQHGSLAFSSRVGAVLTCSRVGGPRARAALRAEKPGARAALRAEKPGARAALRAEKPGARAALRAEK